MQRDHKPIEPQQAHATAVVATFNHATYLEPRRKMMQRWADHEDQQQCGAKVLSIKSA
jgi:hypothetical protein